MNSSLMGALELARFNIYLVEQNLLSSALSSVPKQKKEQQEQMPFE